MNGTQTYFPITILKAAIEKQNPLGKKSKIEEKAKELFSKVYEKYNYIIIDQDLNVY